MTALLLFPDASPLGPSAARASDGADPVAPAAGELPRALSPGAVVTVDGLRGLCQYRYTNPDGSIEVVGDNGYHTVSADAVRSAS